MKASSKLRLVTVGLLAALLLVTAACGDDEPSSGGSGGSSEEAATVRLGYFPNVTHATAIVGVDKGIFQKNLGSNKLETSTFKDGTEASEALSAGAIDATYIGSGPAINLFQKSDGEAIRVVSGAASGGAALVVNDSIQKPEDLAGKTISTPKLGNTQDVSLRAWLKDEGFETDLEGGGDPKIAPQENSLTLDAFIAGDIDGAWVPEPWASRLVIEGKGHVLVDERDIWPERRVPHHRAHRLQAVPRRSPRRRQAAPGRPGRGQHLGQRQLGRGQDHHQRRHQGDHRQGARSRGDRQCLGDPDLHRRPRCRMPSKGAPTQAKDVGLLETDDIEGIYDLTPLNAALKAAGEKEYSDA